MKKVLFLGLALASLHAANAQAVIFKPLKVDVSIGAAIPQGSGSKGGVLFVIEPKYAILDQLSVGLRLEAAVMGRGFTSSADGSYASGSVSANASYLVTGDYYFSNNTLRPFVGAGVGIFDIASASVDNNTTETASAATKFGGMVRAGFEAGHFRLGIEYNLVGSSSEVDPSGFSSTTVTSKNSYLGVKLGVCFGGRRL